MVVVVVAVVIILLHHFYNRSLLLNGILDPGSLRPLHIDHECTLDFYSAPPSPGGGECDSFAAFICAANRNRSRRANDKKGKLRMLALLDTVKGTPQHR